MNTINTELQAVETEIATIQPISNELMDRIQTLSHADARALKATPEWQTVERWKALLTRRAQLRDALEIESALGEE